LSPQARAAAIRAQAARAQAEREEAARVQVERVHTQRAAAAQRGNAPQGQAPGGQGTPGTSQASMWARQTGPTPEAGARGPAGRPQQPVVPPAASPAASARPGAVAGSAALAGAQASPADLHPVRRVALPPASAPADHAPAGRGVPSDARTATPAGAGGYEPAVVAYVPTNAYTGSAQGGVVRNGASAQSQARAGGPGAAVRAPDAVNGSTGTAFVPNGVAPAIGQPFGTVAMPYGQAATPAAISGTAGSAEAPVLPALQSFPTIQVPATGRSATPEVSDDSGPVPQWGSVTSSPWTATSTVGSFGSTPSSSGSSGVAPSTEPLLDEPEDEAPKHPYTWLHMIVLVLVAFILGMLIFMAVSQDDPDGGAARGPAAVVVPDEGTGA
jgi:hypothetical protein